MTDETKGDGMTLDRAIEILDAMLDIRGYCNFEQCLAWKSIKANIARNTPTSEQAFKNFHRSLCARFGYTHDELFWWRDLVSLQEHIAAHLAAQSAMRVDEAKLESMCQAFYENKGNMKWDKLLDCWKENYRSNMRAALQDAISKPQP